MVKIHIINKLYLLGYKNKLNNIVLSKINLDK